tara:strand:- start:737 stop:853 length:117 start_codon:yes stop_codon:yes gene_type:complete
MYALGLENADRVIQFLGSSIKIGNIIQAKLSILTKNNK